MKDACLNCGVPVPVERLTCPFCNFETGLQRESLLQRRKLHRLGIVGRILLTLCVLGLLVSAWQIMEGPYGFWASPASY